MATLWRVLEITFITNRSHIYGVWYLVHPFHEYALDIYALDLYTIDTVCIYFVFID